MDGAREEFAAAGLGLTLIGQGSPRQAAHFRRRQELHVPLLADEDRESYRAIGARVGGVTDLFGPRVLAKGIATIARTGQVQGRTVGNPAQLGAAAIIATDGQIVWRQIAGDAGDTASPAEILAALG